MNKLELFHPDKNSFTTKYFGSNMHLHPDCPLEIPYYSGRCQEPFACCPYCGETVAGYYLPDFSLVFRDENDFNCPACDKVYTVDVAFSGGYSSIAKKCEQGCTPYYAGQTEHEGENFRVAYCIECGNQCSLDLHPVQISVHPDKFPELYDPDFWDPDGVLLPSDAGSDKETPVLDLLRNSWSPLTAGLVKTSQALERHNQIYNN